MYWRTCFFILNNQFKDKEMNESKQWWIWDFSLLIILFSLLDSFVTLHLEL